MLIMLHMTPYKSTCLQNDKKKTECVQKGNSSKLTLITIMHSSKFLYSISKDRF